MSKKPPPFSCDRLPFLSAFFCPCAQVPGWGGRGASREKEGRTKSSRSVSDGRGERTFFASAFSPLFLFLRPASSFSYSLTHFSTLFRPPSPEEQGGIIFEESLPRHTRGVRGCTDGRKALTGCVCVQRGGGGSSVKRLEGKKEKKNPKMRAKGKPPSDAGCLIKLRSQSERPTTSTPLGVGERRRK